MSGVRTVTTSLWYRAGFVDDENIDDTGDTKGEVMELFGGTGGALLLWSICA